MDTTWMLPLSVLASLGTSLAATWFGIRYFTGPRLAAENEQAARRAIRDAVSPLRQRVRTFRAGRSSGRDAGVATVEDGVEAAQLLRLTHDLPARVQRRVERRLDVSLERHLALLEGCR